MERHPRAFIENQSGDKGFATASYGRRKMPHEVLGRRGGEGGGKAKEFRNTAFIFTSGQLYNPNIHRQIPQELRKLCVCVLVHAFAHSCPIALERRLT